jgi:YfiH family protein
MLRGEALSQLNWLRHGFSTRHAGNLGFAAESSRAVIESNRRQFLREVLGEKKAWPVVTLEQIHSDRIHLVDSVPPAQLQGDGMITNVPGLVLAIQTADCLPVLLADPEHRAIGAFHAGWRGTLARIVEKGIGEMRRRFGTDPKRILAAIGPGIHACCYVVGEELREQFQSQFPYAAELFYEVDDADPVKRKYPLLFMTARAPGHSRLGPELHLDLVKANLRQLLDAGVPQENAQALDLCTACCKDLLFSHRAEQGKTGRLLAAIALRPERRAMQKRRRHG